MNIFIRKKSPVISSREKSVFSLVRYIVGSNFITLFIRLISGILQARLVSPTTLGLFNSFGLVLQYAPFLQLGIQSGLYRELPYQIGKGDREGALELASAAQAWALLLATATSILMLGIALWYLANAEFYYAAGWFTNSILAIVLFYNTNYLQITYRTSQDFKKLAVVNVIDSIAGLFLLLLVAWLNYYGLCLRAILIGILGTSLLFIWRPLPVSPNWNLKHLKHLFKIGLPIFVVGQIYSFWSALNLTLVLKFTGVEGVGLFAIVTMATSALEFIPSAVNSVLFPRMAERYGENGSILKLLEYATKPILLTFLVMLLVLLPSWFMIDPVIELLLPNYSAAIPAVQWGLTIVAVSSFYPVNSILQISGNQMYYGVSLALGIFFYIGILLWSTAESISLESFTQAMLCGRIIFAISSILSAFYLSKQPLRRVSNGK